MNYIEHARFQNNKKEINKKTNKKNELTFDRKATMSSYGVPNVPFFFSSSMILTKESFKIRSKDV